MKRACATTRWSSTSISSSFPASTICFVTSTSSVLGVGSPEGWLWTTTLVWTQFTKLFQGDNGMDGHIPPLEVYPIYQQPKQFLPLGEGQLIQVLSHCLRDGPDIILLIPEQSNPVHLLS
jgi:hypothetical protein